MYHKRGGILRRNSPSPARGLKRNNPNAAWKCFPSQFTFPRKGIETSGGILPSGRVYLSSQFTFPRKGIETVLKYQVVEEFVNEKYVAIHLPPQGD